MAKTGALIEIEFDWNKFSTHYRRHVYDVEQVGNDEDVLHDIAETYADLIDPWVPYKTGALSSYVIGEGGKIIYDPVSIKRNGRSYHYAAVQYYGNFINRTRTVHPLATSQWDKVADQYIWDEFRKKSALIIKNKLNHKIVSQFR